MADAPQPPAPVRATQPRQSMHSVFSAVTAASDSSSRKKHGPASVISRSSRRTHGASSHGGDAASTISGSKSSRSLQSSMWGAPSRRRGQRHEPTTIVVRDEDGVDVTPKSLLTLKPSSLSQQGAALTEIRDDRSGTHTPSDWETRSSFSVGLSIAATSDTGSVASTSAASTPRSARPSTSMSDASAIKSALSTPRKPDDAAAAAAVPIPVVIQESTMDIAIAALDRPEGEIDPDQHVALVLGETETEWLLSIESSSVDEGAPASDDVKDRNARYEALLKKNKMGNESLVAREAQTVVSLRKCKDVQVSPPASKDACAAASESDIADCFARTTTLPSGQMDGGPGGAGEDTTARAARVDEAPAQPAAAQGPGGDDGTGANDGKINAELMRDLGQEPSTWIDVDQTDTFSEAVAARQRADEARLLSSSGVLGSLRVIERAVVQNGEHERLRSYRSAIMCEPAQGSQQGGDGSAAGQPGQGAGADQAGGAGQGQPGPQVAGNAGAGSAAPGPQPATPGQKAGRGERLTEKERAEREAAAKAAAEAAAAQQQLPPKAVQLLWQLSVPGLTEGRNVSCFVWSAQEDAVDRIAVGYGSFDSRDRYRTAGLILVWSTRNMRYPERVIRTKRGVTALAWSARHSALLAVGLADGEVQVYNLGRPGAEGETPALTSADSATRHSDPVWDIRWLEQQSDTGSVLVTAATDGRVLQWGMRRGLEVRAELMRLNAGPNPARTHGGQGGAGALRYAGALSCDFHPFLKSIYVVGTEGGTCHKCSTSYSDQYLQTYVGHVGPVLKVRWSPFHPAAFLTAGADWTIRLWDHDRPTPVISLNLDSGGKGGITEPATEFPMDVSWSVSSSTVFACVTGKTFQIWDISNSTMDPIHVEKTNERLTGILFAPKPNILATSSDTGSVSIYRIVHPSLVQQPGNGPEETKERAKLEGILDSQKQ